MGLVRPSDLVMRNSMIGDTIPGPLLGSAMGLSRTTMDSARIAGALAGAGLFAVLGLGYAYVGVVGLYFVALLLTLGTDAVKPERVPGFRLFSEIKAGLVFAWRTPRIAAFMWYAFLVNLCAFPITMGVMPYAAREIFGLDETGLGQMMASFGVGALIGSIIIAVTGGPQRRGRVMSIALLEAAGPAMRGRVMGLRMLAVYGLPIGLIAAGWLVENVGYRGMVLLYGGVGVLATLAIALRWRKALLRD